MVRLASVAQSFESQPMFEILSRVQELERSGEKILRFELGEPDFQTPAHISEAAVAAIYAGNTKYAPSGGMYDLKVAVREATLKSRGFAPSHEQILITPGANSIIYLALKCVLEHGDEVIVPNPGFPTYFSAICSLGGVAKWLDLNPNKNFSFEIEDLERLITAKTRAIIVNSPSNPTGQVITDELMREISEVARQHDILLISDEIYSRLNFHQGGFKSPSAFDQCKSNTLILNGFSKAFSMTGWRLGVAIGPEKLIRPMESLVSSIVSCVPPFVQVAGIAAITGNQEPALEMARVYKRRAELLANGLNKINGINCMMPNGAIYVFPCISGTGLNSSAFCNRLLSKCKISATPGHFFGSNGEGFVRFSVVTSETDIELALARMETEFGLKS
mgnify:CR=1 FL=1